MRCNGSLVRTVVLLLVVTPTILVVRRSQSHRAPTTGYHSSNQQQAVPPPEVIKPTPAIPPPDGRGKPASHNAPPLPTGQTPPSIASSHASRPVPVAGYHLVRNACVIKHPKDAARREVTVVYDRALTDPADAKIVRTSLTWVNFVATDVLDAGDGLHPSTDSRDGDLRRQHDQLGSVGTVLRREYTELRRRHGGGRQGHFGGLSAVLDINHPTNARSLPAHCLQDVAFSMAQADWGGAANATRQVLVALQTDFNSSSWCSHFMASTGLLPKTAVAAPACAATLYVPEYMRHRFPFGQDSPNPWMRSYVRSMRQTTGVQSDLDPRMFRRWVDRVRASPGGRGRVAPPTKAAAGLDRGRPPVVLLVTRRHGATKRVWGNSDAFAAHLRLHYGAALDLRQVHDMGQLNFSEQRWLVEDAAVVIGPHGGWTANLIWARPGTEFIEFQCSLDRINRTSTRSWTWASFWFHQAGGIHLELDADAPRCISHDEKVLNVSVAALERALLSDVTPLSGGATIPGSSRVLSRLRSGARSADPLLHELPRELHPTASDAATQPDEPALHNTDDGCAEWAASGECTTNPAYMLDACALACKAYRQRLRLLVIRTNRCASTAFGGWILRAVHASHGRLEAYRADDGEVARTGVTAWAAHANAVLQHKTIGPLPAWSQPLGQDRDEVEVDVGKGSGATPQADAAATSPGRATLIVAFIRHPPSQFASAFGSFKSSRMGVYGESVSDTLRRPPQPEHWRLDNMNARALGWGPLESGAWDKTLTAAQERHGDGLEPRAFVVRHVPAQCPPC